jgi:hypothetical protein
MGTFLRVWRSEWAGLSRAQLGVAVSAHLPKRKALTTKVIRKWEEGQPPSSTEELEALGKVMRRHGLTNHEVSQYRTAVFAACVDRQYPGVWRREDLACRPDVDEIACEMWRQYVSGSEYPLPADVVEVTVVVKELERAVLEDRSHPAGARQVRKQRAAACLLRHIEMHMHGHGGRGRLNASAADTIARELRAHFGMNGLGLGPTMTVLAHCGWAAEAAIEDCGLPACRRLLQVSEQAEARGEGPVALGTFGSALFHTARKAPALYAGIQRRAEGMLGMYGDQVHVWMLHGWHYNRSCAASVAGEWDGAEAHLGQSERCLVEMGRPLYGQLAYDWAHALLCLRRGDLAEGLAVCERALPKADHANQVGWARLFRTELERPDKRHWARRAST